MPRDMTVEGPRAWIICVVLQNNVCWSRCTASLDQLCIATLRVLWVSDDAIPGSEALSEHVEIVAVEMHGMGSWKCIVNYEAH